MVDLEGLAEGLSTTINWMDIQDYPYFIFENKNVKVINIINRLVISRLGSGNHILGEHTLEPTSECIQGTSTSIVKYIHILMLKKCSTILCTEAKKRSLRTDQNKPGQSRIDNNRDEPFKYTRFYKMYL